MNPQLLTKLSKLLREIFTCKSALSHSFLRGDRPRERKKGFMVVGKTVEESRNGDETSSSEMMTLREGPGANTY